MNVSVTKRKNKTKLKKSVGDTKLVLDNSRFQSYLEQIHLAKLNTKLKRKMSNN